MHYFMVKQPHLILGYYSKFLGVRIFRICTVQLITEAMLRNLTAAHRHKCGSYFLVDVGSCQHIFNSNIIFNDNICAKS